MILPISFCDSTEIFFRRITPAALSETKGKLRWDIAASDYMAELFYDIISILTFKHVDIQVSIFARYLKGILSVISKQSERLNKEYSGANGFRTDRLGAN